MKDTSGFEKKKRLNKGRWKKASKAPKREAAAKRQAERDSRTAEQQLKLLDDMLGKDQGAKRERLKLQQQIEDRKTKS